MAKYKIFKIFIYFFVKCESQLVGLRPDPKDMFNYSVPILRGKQVSLIKIKLNLHEQKINSATSRVSGKK